ncbi:bacterial alpha-L-rhamnosidase-domain-containing protein [Lipomyces starkeyi]|uniref:alpha-L-rhamnosidase n=1 Tax=Lipomyces starkeyi NRRL Y-11557 TaxID=675824 RepID=A0A1E3QCY4_LIPST|nr:hypothetical protein LIPSTDRAFT_204778 [Lipomyces starkeyi NRRL Y-11557]
MKPFRCGIHGFHEVLGIDVDEIRFYWALESDDELAAQTAYRVVLTTSEQVLNREVSWEEDIVWDSQKVLGDAQRDIVCKPQNGFNSTCYYFWRVTVWDHAGRVYHSAVNHFFTAYPRSHQLPPWSMNQTYMPHSSLIFRTWFEDEPNRWKAVWIGDGSDKPLYLRKSFTLPEGLSKGIIFVSGLGHFNLTVNGEPASDHVLDPGWTNYHRTVQFTAYDITSTLQEGENVLGAHIGNGFYAGDQGDRFFWPSYEDNTFVRYGNELCFFAELHLFHQNGQHSVVISDPSWRVRKSATTLANIYASETHDRRLYPFGWDSPCFDDSSWIPAKPLTGPRGRLRYQSQPPVVLYETFEPVSTKTPRPGVVCFDLGQNASTIVKISVEGEAGSEIVVRYAETTYEDGTVCMPDPLFKEFEYGVYSKILISGSGGAEIWSPEFSFTSARYIQVEGVSLEPGHGFPVIHSAVGQHVSSASRRLGSMKTDKDDMNSLLNALYWTFSSNLFSYHTDCPQIEKFGWLEVTHLLAPATQYVREVEALYMKILDDILDAQEPSGLVPTMAPEIRYMCGPLHDTVTWGCAICFLPDILKRYYGSTHVISKVYRAAVRYMEYMRTKERKGGLIEHGLGDWGRDIAFGNSQANIETAVYHECLKCVEMMSRELSLLDEAERFRQWAARIYDVYNQHLLVTDDPDRPYAYYTSLDNYPHRDRTAVDQAVALQFGLVPEKYRDDVMKAFLDDVADGRIRSGEIGLRYLFNTLADAGRPDLVLQMVRQEEHPSYMRFLRRGETTLLEFWQDDCRSKCHDMLGTIYEWFYAAVLGLKIVQPAYKAFSIAPPYNSEFDFVEGSVDCPYGVIKVRFERERSTGEICIGLTIPTSTCATLELPIESSSVEVRREGSEVRIADGKFVDLRQGTYLIRITGVVG